MYRTDTESSGPEFVATDVLITYGRKKACWAPIAAFNLHDCCILLNTLLNKVISMLQKQKSCPASLISWQPESPPLSPVKIKTEPLSDDELLPVKIEPVTDQEPSEQGNEDLVKQAAADVVKQILANPPFLHVHYLS